MKIELNGGRLELLVGDITEERTDAVVNAANSRLAGGGGVDGAIHRAGGAAIMAETRRLYPEGCPTGSAVITGAGHLEARWVIHAVGPVWRGGGRGEAQLLASAYRHSMQLATEHGCRSLAFPSISTGAYGYPVELAARVALETVLECLAAETSVEEVHFVLFDQRTYAVYQRTLEELGRQE